MTISKEPIDALLEMLALTKEVEVDCDGCLNQMAEFVETSLAGATVSEGLRRIEEHLKLCGECREEFEALRQVLSDESDSSPSTS